MKKLLSLPPNLVENFHKITGYKREEWFCTNDPVGKKLGSGGGTTWLLQQAYQDYCEGRKNSTSGENVEIEGGSSSSVLSFQEWLASEKRLILHAGGCPLIHHRVRY